MLLFKVWLLWQKWLRKSMWTYIFIMNQNFGSVEIFWLNFVAVLVNIREFLFLTASLYRFTFPHFFFYGFPTVYAHKCDFDRLSDKLYSLPFFLFLERFYCFCFGYWTFSNKVFLKIKSLKKKKKKITN